MKLARQQYRKVKLAEVKPHPRNPRKGSLEAIGESLEANDFYGAIVVQKGTGYVLAGNHRLLAAKEAGAKELPAMIVDCDDETALRILLADNATSDKAEYDTPELHALLKEIGQEAGTLEGTGWGFDDFRALEREVAKLTNGDVGADEVPEPPVEPRSKPGEIYELGPHRLMCGDARKEEDVRALVGADVPEAMWTDPPYGVDYVGKTKDALTLQGDQGDRASLLKAVFANVDSVLAPGARIYLAAPAGPRGTNFRLAFDEVGWQFHQALVWVKDVFVLGHSDYHYQHEDVLYGWKPGEGRVGRGEHPGTRWYGDNARSTVFAIPRPKRSETHPTIKPVELVIEQLRNSCLRGDVVLDPFAGSGTTLAACEALGLRCLAMEIDPPYADVIRDRYEAFATSALLAA